MFFLIMCFSISASAMSQNKKPQKGDFDPFENPDVDMYVNHWKGSRPRVTHGELINWDIFTQGKHIDPPYKGAVLEYMKCLAYATMRPGSSTIPVTPDGEQEIYYVISGEGTVSGGSKTLSIDKGSCFLIPEGMEFTISNTSDKIIEFIHVIEPTREGFKPNDYILLNDEDTYPLRSRGHGGNVETILLYTTDGTAEFELWVKWAYPLMSSSAHMHTPGWEHIEVAIENDLTFFLGSEIRKIPIAGAYMVPPNDKTTHMDFNATDEIKKFIFIIRKPVDERLDERPN